MLTISSAVVIGILKAVAQINFVSNKDSTLYDHVTYCRFGQHH
jgi:hypothetical protein